MKEQFKDFFSYLEALPELDQCFKEYSDLEIRTYANDELGLMAEMFKLNSMLISIYSLWHSANGVNLSDLPDFSDMMDAYRVHKGDLNHIGIRQQWMNRWMEGDC